MKTGVFKIKIKINTVLQMGTMT